MVSNHATSSTVNADQLDHGGSTPGLLNINSLQLKQLYHKLGYVDFEQAVSIESNIDTESLPKGTDEATTELRSQLARSMQTAPPEFKEYPFGTRAVDRFGEVHVLMDLPFARIIYKDEGTQKPNTIAKYIGWIRDNKRMLPLQGVENFAVEGGKVKITDGNHRAMALQAAGKSSVPVWVALTDPENTARPVYIKDEIIHRHKKGELSDINLKFSKGGTATDSTDTVQQILSASPDDIVKVYHATASKFPVTEQGLRTTGFNNRKFSYGEPGYVYVSIYPRAALGYARFAYPGEAVSVYEISILKKELLPDTGAIRTNRQLIPSIKNTLQDSIRFTGLARIGRPVYANELTELKNVSAYYAAGGTIQKNQITMAKQNVTEQAIKNLPSGGKLAGKTREGQTILHEDGSQGGYLIGNYHKDGGIKAEIKGTGKKLEMQGGEVVITAPAVDDNTKREFEGEMLTNRQILSRINEAGGGVSFADGGDIPAEIRSSGRQYNVGGKLLPDTEIISSCGCKHSMASGGPVTGIEKKVQKAYEAFVREDQRIAGLPETEDDGHPFIICTNISNWIKKNYFPSAEVVGYATEDNEAAELGQDEGGHDFLLLKDQYIIDFWNRNMNGDDQPILLDIKKDAALVNKLYGEQENWVPLVPENEMEAGGDVKKVIDGTLAKIGDVVTNAKTYGARIDYLDLENGIIGLSNNIGCYAHELKLNQSGDKPVEDSQWNAESNHNYWVCTGRFHSFPMKPFKKMDTGGDVQPYKLTKNLHKKVENDFLELCQASNYDGIYHLDDEMEGMQLEWGKYGYSASESSQGPDYTLISAAAKEFNKKYAGKLAAFPEYSDKFNTVRIMDYSQLAANDYWYNKVKNEKPELFEELKKAGFGKEKTPDTKPVPAEEQLVIEEWEPVPAPENKAAGPAGVTLFELDKAKKDLAEGIALQDKMKKANSIIKAGKDVTKRLLDLGFSEKQAEQLQLGGNWWGKGFPPFRLTNNNASNKRLQDRVNMLEAKVKAAEKSASGQEQKYTFDKAPGGYIEVNYPADRVQIFTNDKPTGDLYTSLKKNGWNYSYTNKAWQRKITPQAISNAIYITGAKKEAIAAEEMVQDKPVEELTVSDYSKMLESRNFSYVTVSLYNALPKDFTGSKYIPLVYFSLIVPEIQEAVKKYVAESLNLDAEKIDVSVYPKTYVKESKTLFTIGRYLPNPVNATPEKLLYPVYTQLKNFRALQKDIQDNPEKFADKPAAPVVEKKYESPYKNVRDYADWIEKKTGRKILSFTQDEIIDQIDQLGMQDLVGVGSKKNRVEKAAQMLIYQATKNADDKDLTLEQYAIKKFIGRTFAEAIAYSEPMWVNKAQFENDWKKATGTYQGHKYKVGDYVKYIAGDIDKETWYGVITKIVDSPEHLYRLDAFNLDYRSMDKESTNEKYEVQLTPITKETYDTNYKIWEKNHAPEIKAAPIAKQTLFDIDTLQTPVAIPHSSDGAPTAILLPSQAQPAVEKDIRNPLIKSYKDFALLSPEEIMTLDIYKSYKAHARKENIAGLIEKDGRYKKSVLARVEKIIANLQSYGFITPQNALAPFGLMALQEAKKYFELPNQINPGYDGPEWIEKVNSKKGINEVKEILDIPAPVKESSLPKRKDLIEMIHPLDLGVEFLDSDGRTRVMRKFSFGPEHNDLVRSLTDLGVKESMSDNKHGGIDAIISYSPGMAEQVEEAYRDITGIKTVIDAAPAAQEIKIYPTLFKYGEDMNVPAAYSSLLMQMLKNRGFTINEKKGGFEILKDDDGLYVHDNGGEFSLVTLYGSNQHISNIPYNNSFGNVSPKVLADRIEHDVVEFLTAWNRKAYSDTVNDPDRWYKDETDENSKKMYQHLQKKLQEHNEKNKAMGIASETIIEPNSIEEMEDPAVLAYDYPKGRQLIFAYTQNQDAIEKKFNIVKSEIDGDHGILTVHFQSGKGALDLSRSAAVETQSTNSSVLPAVKELKQHLLTLLENYVYKLTGNQQKALFKLQLKPNDFQLVTKDYFNRYLKELETKMLLYSTADSNNLLNTEIRLTENGKQFIKSYRFDVENQFTGLMVPVQLLKVVPEKTPDQQLPTAKFSYYKGIQFAYKNPYEFNKAIEEFVDSIPAGSSITPEQKVFISYYSGYGGLEKFGAKGKGLMYEFFTPTDVVKKMWGLAYQFGYKGGKFTEPSVGIGEFVKWAPNPSLATCFEINEYSYKIFKLLYPAATITLASFETLFIKNRSSVKNNLDGIPSCELVIGNPPYGKYEGLYAGMGEEKYTHANNWIDYFIFRGLDLLVPGGLLIFIIGTEVAIGGTPWLQQPMSKCKQAITEKAELLDAYRLPNGVFDRTDVLSDIIVLRKK